MSSEHHRIRRGARMSRGHGIALVVSSGSSCSQSGSSGRLIARSCSLGAVSQTPSAGIALLPEHRGRPPSSCTSIRIVASDGSSYRVDHLLPATPAWSWRSPRLCVDGQNAWPERRVSCSFDEAHGEQGVREIRQSLVMAVAAVPSGRATTNRTAEVRSKVPSRGLVAAMNWWRRRPEIRGGRGLHIETQAARSVHPGHLWQRAPRGAGRAPVCGRGGGAGPSPRLRSRATTGCSTPARCTRMGFDLVREGQTLWLLEAGTGRLRLSRASTGSDTLPGRGGSRIMDLPVDSAGSEHHDDRPGIG